MGIHESIHGKVAVLKVSGKLMGGKETKEVHEHVKGLIADKINKVVIDLSKVKWLNSSGIGMLIACYTSLCNAGGKFAIAGATEKVTSLLMITQILTIFKNYETAERAVSALS